MVDGTYLTREARNEVVELAQRNGMALLSVRCDCADDVASERIAARAQLHDNISDARPEFLRWQHENEEADPPGLNTVSVDTSSGTAEAERFIWEILGKICFPDHCDD